MDIIEVITAQDLEQGYNLLNNLSEEEYGLSLDKLVKGRHDVRVLRVGRLLGVTLKQPFAKSDKLDTRSQITGALRSWEFKDTNNIFTKPSERATWQFKVLSCLAAEDQYVNNARDLAIDAQYERGFFWYLLRSFHKAICKDAKLQREISEGLKAVKEAGKYEQRISARVLTGTAAVTVANLLVSKVVFLAALGPAAGPLVAGLLILMQTVGADAFCDWGSEILARRFAELEKGKEQNSEAREVAKANTVVLAREPGKSKVSSLKTSKKSRKTTT